MNKNILPIAAYYFNGKEFFKKANVMEGKVDSFGFGTERIYNFKKEKNLTIILQSMRKSS